MTYIGIDCGLRGCLVILSNNGRRAKFFDTPTLKRKVGKRTRRAYDIPALVALASHFRRGTQVCVERQQAYPKQGGVSNFTTGLGYGLWLGLLEKSPAKYIAVPPRVWQAPFFDRKTEGGKKRAYTAAAGLYPNLVPMFTGPKGGLLDGRCDALLIATYMRDYARGQNNL